MSDQKHEDDFERGYYIHELENYRETGNNIYLWAIIGICKEYGLSLPDECAAYLGRVADFLVYGNHEKNKLHTITQRALGFTHKKQLSAIRSRDAFSDEHDEVTIYAQSNNVSRNVAYDNLELSVAGQLDKHRILQQKNATDAVRKNNEVRMDVFATHELFGELYAAEGILYKALAKKHDKATSQTMETIFDGLELLISKNVDMIQRATFYEIDELLDCHFAEMREIIAETKRDVEKLLEAWQENLSLSPKIDELIFPLKEFVLKEHDI